MLREVKTEPKWTPCLAAGVNAFAITFTGGVILFIIPPWLIGVKALASYRGNGPLPSFDYLIVLNSSDC